MKNKSLRTMVLIVEDDPKTANDLMVEYKRAGDEVVICTEPLEATNVAQVINPQLIIISVGLPTKDGFLLALEMKKVPQLEDTPIVFITPELGCTDSDIARLAFTLGSVDVVAKPTQPDELRNIVQRTAVSKGICQLKQLTLRLAERSTVK